MDTKALADLIVDTIIDKKGSNILILDIREHAVFADYFLICSGDNHRQIQAIVEGITTETKQEANISPAGIEGEADSGWVLVDFGDLVVHVFDPPTRQYYNLEDIWKDAYTAFHMP